MVAASKPRNYKRARIATTHVHTHKKKLLPASSCVVLSSSSLASTAPASSHVVVSSSVNRRCGDGSRMQRAIDYPPRQPAQRDTIRDVVWCIFRHAYARLFRMCLHGMHARLCYVCGGGYANFGLRAFVCVYAFVKPFCAGCFSGAQNTARDEIISRMKRTRNGSTSQPFSRHLE